jgi:hypothetical protein
VEERGRERGREREREGGNEGGRLGVRQRFRCKNQFYQNIRMLICFSNKETLTTLTHTHNHKNVGTSKDKNSKKSNKATYQLSSQELPRPAVCARFLKSISQPSGIGSEHLKHCHSQPSKRGGDVRVSVG